MLVIEDVMYSQATRMDGWMDGYVSVVDVSPIFGWNYVDGNPSDPTTYVILRAWRGRQKEETSFRPLMGCVSAHVATCISNRVVVCPSSVFDHGSQRLENDRDKKTTLRGGCGKREDWLLSLLVVLPQEVDCNHNKERKHLAEGCPCGSS